jgi:REP element-mobilizing transposase RayT
MPNTYTQIHIQFVFAVKYRQALIQKDWKDSLHKYITGIFQKNGHKMICINSMPDHIHILAGMRTHQSFSSIIQNVKTESSKWIREQHLVKSPFAWQSGFGAFSYSRSQLPNIIAYIENQEEHHRAKSFRKEYIDLLDEFKMEYDEQYLFTDLQ